MMEVIYKFICNNCNKEEDYIMSVEEYENFDTNNEFCKHCKLKGTLNRNYANTKISVIYKTTGFHATDSLVDNKQMNQVMKTD